MEVKEEDSDSDFSKSFDENDEEWNPKEMKMNLKTAKKNL